MFTKLLAYEIRSRFRTDARSFGAFIAVIAVAAGLVAAGLPGISGSTAVLAYALCALTPVACAIAAMADYWKTLYGQRGYFTMSLPISGTVIFWAKVSRIVIECLLALALAVGESSRSRRLPRGATASASPSTRPDRVPSWPECPHLPLSS